MNDKVEMAVQDVNEITKKIIGCAFEVSNTLGIGFVTKGWIEGCSTVPN